MKRVALFLSGLVAALSIGAYAVSGGGLPSFPRFQAVGIGTPAGGVGTLKATGTLRTDTGSGTTTSLILTGGNSNFQVQHASGSATVTLTNSGGPIIIAAAGGVVQANGSSIATLGASNTFQTAGVTSTISKAGSAATLGQVEATSFSNAYGGICTSDTANVCETSIPGSYADFFASTGIQFTVGGVNQGQITASSVPWIQPTTTTASIGTAGICSGGGFVAGNMRFVKTGNIVTASWSGTQLSCTLGAAAASVSFPAIIPAGYIPTNTNGCDIEFTTATTGYMAHEQFTSAGAVSVSVLLAATNQSQFFSAGGSCTYVLN